MSEFLERHRKKGLLAFLLMLFKRGKGAGPLLLLVALMSFVFILPSGFLRTNVPWADALARKLGLGHFLGDAGDGRKLADFSDAMREAKMNGQGADGWAEWFGKNMAARTAMNPLNKSTVDMVKPQDMAALQQGAHQGTNLTNGGTGIGGDGGGAGTSVNGILNPDDAQKQEAGVHVDAQELQQGLMKSAYAGMFSPGTDGAGSGASFNRGSALNANSNLVQRTMTANASAVPVVGQGSSVGKGAGGKLGAFSSSAVKAHLSSSQALAGGAGGGAAFYQLAVSKAYSVQAAAPSCTGSCPGEYAANTAGATFDGTITGDPILTSPAIGEPTATTPSSGASAAAAAQASQLEADVQQCQNAEQTLGPQEQYWMNKISQDGNSSQQSCSGGCGGGCSSALNTEQSDCQQYNSVAQQIDSACAAVGGGDTTINCSGQ